MVWSWTPFALPLFAAASLCLLVAALVLLRRAVGAASLAALLGAVSLWCATYALELLSISLAQKLLWSRVQYIGIVLVPVAWLLFALRFSRRVRRIGVAPLALLLAIPLTTLVLLWNPGTSGLIWSSADVIEGPGVELLHVTYGPWFWVHTVYSYTLWIAAAAIFTLALRRSPYLYRKQGLALMLAIFAPYALNVMYVAGISGGLDLTPFGFVITGLATLWTLARQQFLDILPVARARVVEAMRDGVFVLDGEDRIVDLNPAAAAIVDKPAASVIGTGFEAALSGRVELRKLAGQDDELQFEAVLSGEDEPRTYELRSWPLTGGGGPIGRLLVFRNITRRKRAEQALRASEKRLRVVTEQMPAVLWTTDADLRFTQMLGAGLQNLGVDAEAVTGMDLFELSGTIDETHPAIAAHMQALEGSPTTYSVEWFGRDFECHVEPLHDDRDVPCGVIGVGLDVTERQDLQEQLRQSQKMEAIGRMAGGVAHDFNNLLTAVAGYAQLAHEDLEGLDSDPQAVNKLRRDLDAIGHAAERATSITAQLLAFSRKQVLQPRTLSLNRTLEEMHTMLRRLLGANIDLLTFLDPECDPVRIDPVQVQQVVINLVLNARDAMPSGGEITFETSNAELGKGLNVPYDVIPPGRYVVLEISDDGFGMDKRTRARLFEPFFTTKEAGKGTGLGLSTVYGIVRQTGGYIDVDSELGKGSTFRVYFPAVDAAEAVAKTEEEPQERQMRGSETVLLVEDEDMVRELASRVLSSNGYLVLEAETGDEALEVCRRHEGPVDLLVTDVVMPGMNGSELAQRIETIAPDVTVLFMSGYTGGALIEHGVLRQGTQFLQKPFSPQRFLRKVREVLNGGS